MIRVEQPDSAQGYSTVPPLTANPVGGGFQSVINKQLAAPKGMEDIFAEMSERYGVPENLLRAVAKAESNFRTDAVSSCGAMGVMQLMPSTAKSLGVTDPYDSEQNIMGGAKLLSQLLAKYDGDTKLALAAYNAGSGNVEKYGGIPPFKETQNYVKKVMQYCGENISIPTQGIKQSNNQLSEYNVNGTDQDEFTYEDYKLFAELFFAQMLALQSGQTEQSSFQQAGMFFLG